MTVLDIVEYAVGGIAHVSCYADTTALTLKGVSKRIFRIVRDTEGGDRYIPYHKSVFIKVLRLVVKEHSLPFIYCLCGHRVGVYGHYGGDFGESAYMVTVLVGDDNSTQIT